MASQSLGTRLRAERESRGFSLVQIADSTKIPAALLQSLERNDLSRWPKGLYRRAFFRSYVTALGLPPEPLVAEFARLFPDDTDSTTFTNEPVNAVPSAADVAPLALSWAGPSNKHRRLRSVAVAVLEVAGVAALGGVIAWGGGIRPLEAIAAVALVYLPAIRLAGGRIRGLNLVRRRTPATQRVVEPLAALSRPLDLEGQEPATAVSGSGVYRWRPAVAGITNATRVAWPAARRTGQLLQTGADVTGRVSMRAARTTSSVLMRMSRVAGLRLAIAARATRRLASRGFAVASHAFWKGVRSAAEHAELLAIRQLNRRVVDPPAD